MSQSSGPLGTAPAKAEAELQQEPDFEGPLQPHQLIHNFPQTPVYTDGKTFSTTSLAIARKKTSGELFRIVSKNNLKRLKNKSLNKRK